MTQLRRAFTRTISLPTQQASADDNQKCHKIVNNVKIREFGDYICNHHEKCIQIIYKQAWYWFRNLWTCENLGKANRFCIDGETNDRGLTIWKITVLSIDDFGLWPWMYLPILALKKIHDILNQFWQLSRMKEIMHRWLNRRCDEIGCLILNKLAEYLEWYNLSNQ